MALSQNIEEIHMAVLPGITRYELVPAPEFHGTALGILAVECEVNARSWFDI